MRYEPAVLPLEIGGDWYDVLPIGEHRIGIVVGDCVGRGLPAAAIMGQLRSSARALLINGAEPAVLLDQLDSAASLIPNAYCTTVFLAILDTETGLLQYSNAGHMPAVLIGPEPGTTTLLTDAASVPLAVRRDEPRPQATRVLPPGSTLMLFTDGLVERKHESIDDGIARAADVLAQTMTLPLDTVADEMLRELAPAGGYDDDVAMVIYRHHQTPLRIERDATADQLVRIRHRLADWLRAAHITGTWPPTSCWWSTRPAPIASNTPTADSSRGRWWSRPASATAKCAPGSPITVRGRRRPPTRSTVGAACP